MRGIEASVEHHKQRQPFCESQLKTLVDFFYPLTQGLLRKHCFPRLERGKYLTIMLTRRRRHDYRIYLRIRIGFFWARNRLAVKLGSNFLHPL